MSNVVKHWTEEDVRENHSGPRRDPKAVNSKTRRQRNRKQIQEELDTMDQDIRDLVGNLKW